MELEIIIFILFFVILVLLIWRYIKKRIEREKVTKEVWHNFTRMKGLTEGKAEGEADLVFRGQNQGFPFILERVLVEGKPTGEIKLGRQKISFKRGDTLHIYTRMKLQLPHLPPGIHVYKEKSLNKLAKILGAQDIKVGDPEFDRAFMIKGDNAEAVKGYLTSERRSVLKRYMQELGPVELREDGIYLERKEQIKDLMELEKLYTRMGEMALALV